MFKNKHKFSISNRASAFKLWHTIPRQYKNVTFLNRFKKFKKKILNKYSNDVY